MKGRMLHKVTVDQVVRIKELARQGSTHAEIRIATGLDTRYVSCVLRGVSGRYIGGAVPPKRITYAYIGTLLHLCRERIRQLVKMGALQYEVKEENLMIYRDNRLVLVSPYMRAA